MRRTPFKRKPYKWKRRKPISTVGSDSVAAKPKTEESSHSSALRKADTAFSLFIRTRDAQPYEGRAFRCISCNRVLPIEQADCGHYVNRQHMSLRFSEQNCHAQCRQCNRFDEGNIQEYRRGLIRKIGESRVNLLEALKHETHKLTALDLEFIARHYKSEVKKFQYQIK